MNRSGIPVRSSIDTAAARSGLVSASSLVIAYWLAPVLALSREVLAGSRVGRRMAEACGSACVRYPGNAWGAFGALGKGGAGIEAAEKRFLSVSVNRMGGLEVGGP